MDAAELFEEIRTRLNELQVNTVDRPWTYRMEDFIPQVRSVLRHLRAMGIVVTPTMAADGTLSAPLTDSAGVLVGAMVTQRMLRGDLLVKLRDGELGVVFKTGGDSIDTKGAANLFKSAADMLEGDIQGLLMVALNSDEQLLVNDGAYHYGGQEPYSE